MAEGNSHRLRRGVASGLAALRGPGSLGLPAGGGRLTEGCVSPDCACSLEGPPL